VTGKRIVLTTWGSFGDLHPYMALALELKRRGHRPVIGTIPQYRNKVERAGIGFWPVRPDAPNMAGDPELVRRAMDARTGSQVVMGELLMPFLRETYDDTLALIDADGGTDLLVTHILSFAAHMIAEKTPVRWLSTVLSPIAFLSAYDPPTPPQAPWVGRVARWHPAIARLVNAAGRRLSAGWVREVLSLRRELGLSSDRHPIFDYQFSPEGTLALYSPLFGSLQPDFPPNSRITGFTYHDVDETRGGMTPELERFFAECDSAGEAPLLFTLGSSAIWLAGDYYPTALEAATALGRRALLLVGAKENLDAGSLPPGVAAVEYAPFGEVMPRSAVIVHQGGVGTTAQALRAGRPMLIMPFGHDTLDNAARAERMGVARTLPRKRFTPDAVARELSVLLGDGDYRTNAEHVGRAIRAEEGTAAACDVIEGRLAEGRRGGV
jgi:UDP:flavonoid glycosyltransferase YjiC (YdhE family)